MNVHGLIESASPPVLTGGSFVSVKDIRRILRRNIRMILLVVALVMSSAAATYLLLPPRYDATAVMRVIIDDVEPNPGQPGASARDVDQWRAHQIETQIQLLQSRLVARQTVRDLALHDDPEFNPAALPGKRSALKGAPTPETAGRKLQLIERTADRLLSATKVAQDGQSDFINVTVSARSPAKAARIANKIAGNYVKVQMTERQAARSRVVERLQRQTQQLRGDLIAAEMAVATYRRRHDIDGGAGRDAEIAEMSRLGSELAAAGAARAEAGARVGASGQVMSPLLGDLRNQQTAVQRRLAELSTLYGRAHPDVARGEAELGRINDAIGVETSRIEGQLSNEATAQASRAGMVAGRLGAMRARSLVKGVESVALADLERRADTARALYLSLSQRLQEALRLRDNVRPDATMSSAALLPTSASFPRAGQLFGLAVGASVVFSLLAVLLAEALQNQVRTSAEVLELVDLPTFGMVPDLDRRAVTAAHLKVAREPYSVFAEAVRATEAKIRRYMAAHGGNVVLITSPLPGDGKTTVAISLAAAAVANGRSAVMIDLDLRRPGLRDVLDGSRCEVDLLDYLAGKAELNDILVDSPTLPGLQAVPVREPAIDPGAALNSARLAVMFAQLRERFDVVIVNTPPVLAVGDASLLTEHADTVMLLLRWGRSTAELIRAAVLALDVPPTGVIFNRVSYAKHARLSYGDALQYRPRQIGADDAAGPRRLPGIARLFGS